MTFPIAITEEAEGKLKEALKEDAEQNLRAGIIRIAIQGGGCSGLQYKLDIDDKTRDDDYVLEKSELTVVIDGHSATVLRDTVLDYTQNPLGQSGFVFQNPNAKRHCGCGSSFGY